MIKTIKSVDEAVQEICVRFQTDEKIKGLHVGIFPETKTDYGFASNTPTLIASTLSRNEIERILAGFFYSPGVEKWTMALMPIMHK